jgi:SAM-dependent methyltransferase
MPPGIVTRQSRFPAPPENLTAVDRLEQLSRVPPSRNSNVSRMHDPGECVAVTFTNENSRFGLDPTHVFDPAASEYQMARPSYPHALYDTLDRFIGGLSGRVVVDLGAGTGIVSGALAQRGATVMAVEPSLAMLNALRSAYPTLDVAAGRAESLPLRSRAVDLITCAQAWHWVEPIASALECRRVLRPGGHLALWSNVSDSGAAWLKEIQREVGLGPYGAGPLQDDEAGLVTLGGFAGVYYEDIPWEWTVPIDHWLRLVVTRRSALAAFGLDAQPPLLASIEGILRRHFPEGHITESFTCHHAVAYS